MIFPLNAGVVESTFEGLLSGISGQYYTVRGSNSDIRGNAYKDVSVNPVLLALGLQEETAYPNTTPPVDSNGDAVPVSSAMFTEIRKGPHTDGISVQCASSIQNRLLPTASTSLSTYATNKENTPSYKVKIYDSTKTNTSTNRKATYSTVSDCPDSNIGLDIENRDYFILLNPEIYDHTTREDTVRPHFARITRITTFDEFGDGVEFEPKYTGEIAKGTKFEIYKGPHKTTDSDVVAVSYGLRGDTDASTNKYDKISIVNTPTFYFYNDRLEVKNQLDYNEKYTLTSVRYWGTGTNYQFNIDAVVATGDTKISQYEEGNLSNRFLKAPSAELTKLVVGTSLFRVSDGKYLGNINSTQNAIYTKIVLDYARIDLPATTTAFAVTTGTTIQNVVFKTERKYGNTIQNLGRSKLDAVLVDNNMVTDDADSNIDPIFWHKTFPKMKRHTEDSSSVNTNTIDGKMNGPAKYITWESAELKNDKLPVVMDTVVNSPRNKLSKLARVKGLDNAGIQHLKYKEEDKLVVRNGIYSNNLDMQLLFHKVTTNSTQLEFNNKSNDNADTGWKYDYSAILGADSIILIGDYYYRVNAIDAKADGVNQKFSVSHKRLKTASTWTQDSTPPTVSSADIYASVYSNSKLITGFSADTEIITSQNNRITMDNHTVSKESTKLYNSRVYINGFKGHDIKVEYGDRNLKYLSLQSATDKYYQKTPKDRVYYYGGSYTLHEEVFTGKIEDITSSMENGMLYYDIVGRDNTSSLLGNTFTKNLNYSNDIVKSTLNPSLVLTEVSGGSTDIDTDITSTTVGVNGSVSFGKYTLLFDSNKQLIGEVSSTEFLGGFNRTSITLLDKAYIGIESGNKYYYYNPFSAVNFISLNKAMGANTLMNKHPTDLNGASDVGITFEKGLSFDSTLATTNLNLSSNVGDKSQLGYDVNSVKSISDFDSEFLLKLANEQDDYITHITKSIQSSNYLSVVNVVESETNNTVIEVSSQFPMALGLIDDNKDDTRLKTGNDAPTDANTHFKNASMYLVNTNIPKGGYLHRLNNTFNNFYTSKDIFRYMDLQQFDAGTIRKIGEHPSFQDVDSIYLNGKLPSKISGYTLSHNITLEGVDKDAVISSNNNLIQLFTETGTTNSIYTSNALNAYNTNNLGLFPARDGYWEENALSSATVAEITNLTTEGQKFIQRDYRTRTYELFALGDLFPDSYLRYNHISHNSINSPIKEYGLLLEGEGTKGTQVEHSGYTGKTSSQEMQDKDYDMTTIIDSNITNTKDLMRWGVIRLTEATFDWHFNPVDSDALKDRSEIPRVPILELRRFTNKEPTVSWSNGVNAPDFDLLLASDDYLYSLGDTDTYGSANSGINFTLVHFVSPNLALTIDDKLYFSYNSLMKTITNNNVTTMNSQFEPHNIFLPVFSETRTPNNPDLKDDVHSGVHYGIVHSSTPASSVDGTVTNNVHSGSMYHTSKVLSALSVPNLTGTNGIPNPSHYYADFPSKTIYDNCIAVFRNIKNITEKDESNSYDFDSSCKLTIDNDYTTQNVDVTLTTQNQHNKNMLLRKNQYIGADNTTNTYPYVGTLGRGAVFVGMKSEHYPLINGSKKLNNAPKYTNHSSTSTIATDAKTTHIEQSGGNEYGKAFAAQMLIKPQFNIIAEDYSSSPTVITRRMDSASTHHWLHYMVDLTGQYIVGPNITAKGTPSYIGKIISHTKKVTTVNSRDEWEHTITFDKDLSATGTYRLMRISETTFDETPDFFEINVMDDSGLQHDKIFADFRTGDTEGDSKSTNSEGVYSMNMLLELDTANTYLERRVFTNMDMFTNGEEIDTYITDGINTQRKSLSVTKSNNELKFEYDGKISANGCVSFGKVINLTLPKKLNITPKNAFLGTTVRLGSKVDNVLEEIAKESGLDLNIEESLKEYTDLIVKSNYSSGNEVTLSSSPVNVAINDVIYNQDGYLIGKITAKNTTSGAFSVTFGGGIVFTPSPFDELTKRNKNTFVTNVKFESVDSFSAINYLANLKDLDFKIKNNAIITRNLSSPYALRKYHVSYSKNNNLIRVQSNKTLFDKKTKVIVVGDGVKAEMELPTNNTPQVLRHVDASIKTPDEAKIKALKLLNHHNKDVRKIKLVLQKKGIELLEAGDIISLDFPNQQIPRDDYMVFDIENVLSGTAEITVGTFDKSIAERLSEINLEQQNANFTLFTKNVTENVVGKALFDEIKINNNLIKYEIKSTSDSTTMGVDLILGFGNTLGFGETSTTTNTTYESEKDV